LPFATARAWLTNQTVRDLGDTEGATVDGGDDPTTEGRCALRWRGDESALVNGQTLKPGHTIVVPASYGGIRRNCFDATSTDPISDCAERAAWFARARPVLRLNAVDVANLGLAPPHDGPAAVRVA